MRKLPARWLSIVMPLSPSLKTTFVVSGIATLKSLGLVDGFFAR